jgi:DNA-binding transcriptional MocR family regulator
MERVRRLVAARALGPGEKLPSIRRLAGQAGVSPSTVAEAYDRLVAEGLIRSRPGAGFVVVGAPPPLPLADAAPDRDRAIDPFWVSRQSLDARSADMPGCGWLPAEAMPNAAVRRALRALARAPDATLANYGGTRGTLALRRHVARLAAADGIEVGPDRVLLTASGTQAIDLVCRLFLSPGDTVVVDDPCYFNFQALLKANRVAIVGIPFTRAGPDPRAFAEALATHRPRLYITNSALHNPTGATLSPQVAHQVLTAAAAHDVTVVEDDIFAHFEPEPSPRLAALDGLDRVIRIGSFSKVLSASIRVGYVAARADIVEALIDLQIASSFGAPSPLAAELVAAVIGEAGWAKHLAGLHRRLGRARGEVAGRLRALGIEPWLMPRGGFYLWCSLPDGLDAADVARRALDEDVVLAPGNVFSVSRSAAGFMRVNVAQTSDAALGVLERALGAAAAQR